MSKGMKRLLIAVVAISAGISGVARAQEIYNPTQAFIDKLGGKIYTTGRAGSMTIEGNAGQTFVDRLSGVDRFAGEATRPVQRTRAPGQSLQTQFEAEVVEPTATPITDNPAQAYIERMSNYRYR
ncbi:MAG: hypothetical protein ACLP8A_10345 [Methylovirgula sp.]